MLLLAACGSVGADPSMSTPPPASVPTRTGDIGPTAAAELAPEPVEVAYGPHPLNSLDVYATAGDSLGTIMYVHGGGWTGGSKDNMSTLIISTQGDLRDAAAPILADEDDTAGERVILAQIQNGWDVVAIDYRLATPAAGDGVRAPQLLNDVDRAVRYVQAHAADLGLNMDRFVISGGSAGGHLALLEAQGAPFDRWADPLLPPDLASIEPRVDAVAGFVGPTDLFTLWMAGGIGPSSSESLLGCTQASTPAIPGMSSCDPEEVARYSPLDWSTSAGREGRVLPPAYLVYGGLDTLVRIDTQGVPNIEAWSASAGGDRTWYDLPPEGGHNIDDAVNYLAFNAWLARVVSGDWSTGP
jgi:acetyl esterase/lipase